MQLSHIFLILKSFSLCNINVFILFRCAFTNIFNLLEHDGECFMIVLGEHPVFDVYRILSRTSKWCTWVKNVQNYISPYHDSEVLSNYLYFYTNHKNVGLFVLGKYQILLFSHTISEDQISKTSNIFVLKG